MSNCEYGENMKCTKGFPLALGRALGVVAVAVIAIVVITAAKERSMAKTMVKLTPVSTGSPYPVVEFAGVVNRVALRQLRFAWVRSMVKLITILILSNKFLLLKAVDFRWNLTTLKSMNKV